MDNKKVLNEIIEMYRAGNIAALSKIVDSKEENGLRKIAAHLILQSSKDIRRQPPTTD